MTVVHDHPAAVARTPAARLDRLLAAGAVWSGLHLLIALRWLLDPAARPAFQDGDDYGLASLLPPVVLAWSLLGLAATGLVLALVARRHRPSTGLLVGVAAEAVLLAALASDLGVLSLLGYACAVLGPAAFLAVLVVGGVRDRRARPWLLAATAVVVAGALAGLLRPRTLAELGGDLAAGLGRNGLPPLHLALLLGGAALWAVVAVLLRRAATARCAVCGRPGPRWTEPDAALRWGRIATWIAAAGPLPYALLRATWATPWPLGLPAGEALEPATRLFGLALGAAALGGAVLTVGLVRPWGEVWPRWVPGLRGRPVPVRVPVVAGGLVAVVLLAATPGVLGHGFSGLAGGEPERAAFLLVFPTLPWGLALAAAVTAYAYRRRGVCRTCGQGRPAVPVRP
ncbi:UNVERIFIED_ORG: hypothetical protein E4P37_08990 [Bacillus sp. AZ43]